MTNLLKQNCLSYFLRIYLELSFFFITILAFFFTLDTYNKNNSIYNLASHFFAV